ncbi:GNAT family N-acetyltransferase [Oligoflexus tunisiensis]|uniref:GNAT family N-acetyltransferase n=1 Tax=Oligoflexus tunisiensis TaxID=708132 RepID=UPI00114CD7BD|nr:GNAT family N-acetyltransferase [Oligoflexus tunisiensis]
MQQDVEILSFEDKYAPYFDQINREWIQDMFRLEETDEHILKNPRAEVIDRGGVILFAKAGELGIVGTGALLKTGAGSFELTKMGVLKKARGLKVGEKLLQGLIEAFRQQKATVLYLLTNTDCEAAIHLYEKNGFVHDAGIMNDYGKKYQRCNVAMRLADPAPGWTAQNR